MEYDHFTLDQIRELMRNRDLLLYDNNCKLYRIHAITETVAHTVIKLASTIDMEVVTLKPNELATKCQLVRLSPCGVKK